ncbi:prolyl oligopeptidase family serine peptidase [Arsenicicoccus dermatophilus]|uniref:prolyl oligopeptidase family serine peptidase n=1 Tax=Arsenicicoccus dermatophilus TaxID=1076331 RepID=UPI003916F18E
MRTLAHPLPCPPTRRDDLVEELHGHRVPDPYRWLEDERSPQTQEWVAAQAAYAEEQLAALPGRERFLELMTAIATRPRVSTPWVSKGRYLRTTRCGDQRQEVVHVADSLDELLAGGRVLVDPNAWSDDGTVSLACLTVAPGGRWFAVGRSESGSDWTHVQVVDESGTPVEDHVTTTKFSSPTWLPDGRSHLYNGFAEPVVADGTSSARVGARHLWVHQVGGQDWEIVGFEDEPDASPWPVVSDDDAWLVVHLHRGTERRGRVWLYPLTLEDGWSRVGDRVELVPQADAAWTYVGSVGGELIFLTDDGAPRGRVVAVDPAGGRREIVPEGADAISQVVSAGEILLVERLVDATPVISRVTTEGDLLGDLDLPGGAVVALEARSTSSEVFVGTSTVVEQEASHRVDAVTGAVTALPRPESDWTPPGFAVERHRATSADGTAVPYFLVRPAGVATDAPSPTILYGYGGFAIPILADHRATWPAWLAAGGSVAIANLRGGGEFGAEWYDQGRREHKQHTFDDAIAVAEHLVATGATTPAQLALHGKSNGGLLTGAVLTQRPDLFAAALPHVGVLDAVRFPRFTIGAAWISDYGDPQDPGDLARLLAWSPLHNVRPGTRYPATLIATSDHDDRVVPAHSFKFAAALQHAQAGDAPVLLRVERSTGHNLADRPPAVVAAEGADLLAFAAAHTGLDVS